MRKSRLRVIKSLPPKHSMVKVQSQDSNPVWHLEPELLIIMKYCLLYFTSCIRVYYIDSFTNLWDFKKCYTERIHFEVLFRYLCLLDFGFLFYYTLPLCFQFLLCVLPPNCSFTTVNLCALKKFHWQNLVRPCVK